MYQCFVNIALAVQEVICEAALARDMHFWQGIRSIPAFRRGERRNERINMVLKQSDCCSILMVILPPFHKQTCTRFYYSI